jgi:hypothetical protein
MGSAVGTRRIKIRSRSRRNIPIYDRPPVHRRQPVSSVQAWRDEDTAARVRFVCLGLFHHDQSAVIRARTRGCDEDLGDQRVRFAM